MSQIKCNEYQPEKLATDDVNDKFCDIIKDDIEVRTEPNAYEKFEEYVKQVELKQSDDISGKVEVEKNVDVIRRLIYYGVKTLCLRK